VSRTYDDDSKLIMNGMKPRYLVCSKEVNCPFVNPELAIQWHYTLSQKGIPSIIIDLRDYDWDENPLNIKLELIDGNPSTPSILQ